MREPWEETEPVIATVDHADIRGLVSTLLVSVGRRLRSRHECWITLNVIEGCANTGRCVSSLGTEKFVDADAT